MVRSKLPLKLIGDQRRRNSTFHKRKTGLKKKAMELAMLCDVPTLLVCFGPEGQVDVWPEDRAVAYGVISRFYSARAQDRGKRRYDVSTFFGDVVRKQSSEEGGEEGDVKYCLEEQLLGLMSDSSLQELEWALDARLRAIEERMGALRDETSRQGGELDVEGLQQPEQGQPHCYYLLGTPSLPAGEENLYAMDACWGNPNGICLDEDAAAVLSGLHQTPMQPLLHGGAVVPPAFNSTIFPAAYFHPHSDIMGTGNCSGASVVYDPHLSSAALAGYQYHHPDAYSTQAYPSTDTKVGCSPPPVPAPAMATVVMPPSPRSAFLDYNAAGGSALCAMRCYSSDSPMIVPGDVVLLSGAGGCGSGVSAQVTTTAASSSNHADGMHRRGELLQVDPVVVEGLENPWGSSIYPAYPLDALAADGLWTTFAGS